MLRESSEPAFVEWSLETPRKISQGDRIFFLSSKKDFKIRFGNLAIFVRFFRQNLVKKDLQNCTKVCAIAIGFSKKFSVGPPDYFWAFAFSCNDWNRQHFKLFSGAFIDACINLLSLLVVHLRLNIAQQWRLNSPVLSHLALAFSHLSISSLTDWQWFIGWWRNSLIYSHDLSDAKYFNRSWLSSD